MSRNILIQVSGFLNNVSQIDADYADDNDDDADVADDNDDDDDDNDGDNNEVQPGEGWGGV